MEVAYSIVSNISSLTVIVCLLALLKLRKVGGEYLHALLYTYAITAVIFVFRQLFHRYSVGPIDGSDAGYMLLQSFLSTTFLSYPIFLWVKERHKSSEMLILALIAPLILLFGIYQTATASGIIFRQFDPIASIIDGSFITIQKLLSYIVCLFTVTYSLFVVWLTMRHYRHNRLIVQFVCTYQFAPLIMILMFLDSKNTYAYAIAYHAMIIIVTIILTYAISLLLEKFEPQDIIKGEYSQPRVPAKIITPLVEKTNARQIADVAASNPALWRRIEELMQSDEQPWRAKDLQIGELAKMLRSNRTSVSREIHLNGYQSFYDYVAQYRIAEFCKMLDDGKVKNITLAFNAVGFHSVSTAFKQFRRIHNQTPAQYIAKIQGSQEA